MSKWLDDLNIRAEAELRRRREMKVNNDNWTIVDGVNMPKNVLARAQGMANATGKVMYSGFSRMRDDWVTTNDREQVKVECDEFVGTVPLMPISIRECLSPLPPVTPKDEPLYSFIKEQKEIRQKQLDHQVWESGETPVPSEEVTFIRVLEYKGKREAIQATLRHGTVVQRDRPYVTATQDMTITQLLCDELKGER